jgi:hypothetical protein
MAMLPAVPHGLGYRNTANAELHQGVAHVVKFVRPDDCRHLFHQHKRFLEKVSTDYAKLMPTPLDAECSSFRSILSGIFGRELGDAAPLLSN